MIALGQFALLTALVAIGFASFASLAGSICNHRKLLRTGLGSAMLGLLALTTVMIVLVWALLCKDFRLQYVAQYSSRTLPWYYSISALWVGQAGSLLLWSWMLGIVSMVFRVWPRRPIGQLRDTAFGYLMAYAAFLVATMVFAADPMEKNLAPGHDGLGLSPLLHHPAMLIHPPIVFLGYAAWAVPCALALAALTAGAARNDRSVVPAGENDHGAQQAPMRVGSSWLGSARPWSLLGWSILGSGILLGAYWSYEELGWGGYWAWDPVENGSLIPWLIGTALIHSLMVWQSCGMLKKTTIALAIACFAACNFATFLTRSGIFSSLHAFSQSPIGWLFLAMMVLLGAGGMVLMTRRRQGLVAERTLESLWTREAFIVISTVALLLLALVTSAGTLSVALSEAIIGRRIMVGPEFYNHVVIPIGVVLLATMSAAPLLRWRSPPQARELKLLGIAAAIGLLFTGLIWLQGIRHPLALTISCLAIIALVTHLATPWIEHGKPQGQNAWKGFLIALSASRRSYAGFIMHLGFACVVVGITGSSLGSQQNEVVLERGESIAWADHVVRFERLVQREQPGKYIVEAELDITSNAGDSFRLLPAQHLHRLQDQWTTEVAIHSTWKGDFYTILHHGEGNEAVRLTLIENPAMRFLWLGGWVVVAGTGLRLWPSRKRFLQPASSAVQPAPPQTSRPALDGSGRRGIAAANA